MGLFPKPCLDCGILVAQGTRCATHQSLHQAKIDERRINKRDHYKGNYQSRARKVRENAEICHICKQGFKPNDPFQADHLIAGLAESPLLPAHRSCNIRKGNKFNQ